MKIIYNLPIATYKNHIIYQSFGIQLLKTIFYSHNQLEIVVPCNTINIGQLFQGSS